MNQILFDKCFDNTKDEYYQILKLIEENKDYPKIKTEGRELKAWEAIARYMESFEDTDGNGIPNVSDRYATEEGRKVVEDSKKIGDLLKSPNQFFFMILGVILVVLLLLILIIVLFVKLIRTVVKKVRK